MQFEYSILYSIIHMQISFAFRVVEVVWGVWYLSLSVLSLSIFVLTIALALVYIFLIAKLAPGMLYNNSTISLAL